MGIIIRKAGIDDLEELMNWRMEVLHDVFEVPAEQDMTELKQANRRYYQTMLENGGHIAAFACLDGEITGCGGICIYQEMPSPENPSGMCAYLMNIYVRPVFRGQGIGKIIVGWLTTQAKQLGITKIYLETSESGRKLYQNMGFMPMADYMKL